MHDLIIRGGTIVDGSGNPRVEADIAIDGDRITAVGRIDGNAARTIDATGCLVTPGWVDVHTHYDGQATWDPILAPSSWHGVTTVVMGNCGVGFAPVRPGQEKFLIELMEGVEDIPGIALNEGMDWRWETFARISRCARRDAAHDRHRDAGAARRSARVRDGRPLQQQRRSADRRRNRGDGRHRARRHQSRRARFFEFAHAAAQRQERRAHAGHVCRQRRDAGARPVDERSRSRRLRAGLRPPRQRRRMGVGETVSARDRPTGHAGCDVRRRVRRQQDVPHRRGSEARRARRAPADGRPADRRAARSAIELPRVHPASVVRRRTEGPAPR